MAETPQTGTPPAGTGTQAPATPPAGGAATGGGAAGEQGTPQDQNKELVAQRDRANQLLKDNGIDPKSGKKIETPPAGDAGESRDDFLAELYQERYINGFLKDNKDKYPDVTLDDLKLANSPSQVQAEAERVQKRIEDATKAKLEAVQIADQTPKLTDSQIDEQVEELKKSNDPKKFQKMVALRAQKSKR